MPSKTNHHLFRQASLAEVIVLLQQNPAATVYVDDAYCTNIVEARHLSIRFRPRLNRWDIAYKVGLHWRSRKVYQAHLEPFFLPKDSQD